MEQVRAGYTAEKEFHLSLNRYKENYSDFILVCNINDAYESFASAFYSLFWLKNKTAGEGQNVRHFFVSYSSSVVVSNLTITHYFLIM